VRARHSRAGAKVSPLIVVERSQEQSSWLDSLSPAPSQSTYAAVTRRSPADRVSPWLRGCADALTPAARGGLPRFVPSRIFGAMLHGQADEGADLRRKMTAMRIDRDNGVFGREIIIEHRVQGSKKLRGRPVPIWLI
jgi:hypothetical protein